MFTALVEDDEREKACGSCGGDGRKLGLAGTPNTDTGWICLDCVFRFFDVPDLV